MGQTNFRSGIFVSYSHADRDWLERLQTHLAPHVRGEKLDLWDDTKIAPGADWAAEIDQAISKARVADLLVSPDFLASQFIADVEFPAILRRAGSDLTIIWIPIRSSAWSVTPRDHLITYFTWMGTSAWLTYSPFSRQFSLLTKDFTKPSL